jgi:ribonucleoside-diphosphate reductase alpha chain
MWKNTEIAKHIHEESLKASQWMAQTLGEPEWCIGYGVRNTHRIAIAPTKSTAALMGGVSEGINPDPAMVYTQLTSAGEVERVNPALLKIMKERKVFNKKTVSELKDKMGSVQHVDWLDGDEKRVFKTAFEINQEVVIRLASQRAKYIDQWQSLNLFFSAEESEAVISKVHQMAFEDESILALYYIYSSSGVQASNGECTSCQ